MTPEAPEIWQYGIVWKEQTKDGLIKRDTIQDSFKIFRVLGKMAIFS